jgi:hypothetical protein
MDQNGREFSLSHGRDLAKVHNLMSAPDSDATMAVFLDLENIAIGALEAQFPAFDIR